MSISYALILQPTAIDRDHAIPKPETPVWKTERDLIVLFENTVDRKALALAIMSESLNANTNLTSQQRFDGLHIAGHTLFREYDLNNAIACFSGIISLEHTDDATADAARMKAQCHTLLNEYAQAVQAYQLMDSISRQIELDTGFHDLYRLTISNYLNAALMSNDEDLVYAIVNEINNSPEKFEHSETSTHIFALQTGARMAQKTENTQQELSYLNTLLDSYPTFGMEFPGERIHYEIQRLKAQDPSSESNNQATLELIMNIVMDERYFGMPNWAFYVDKAAYILEKSDHQKEGIDLRLWAIDELQTKLDELDSTDHFSFSNQLAIRESQSSMIFKSALQYEKTRQYQHAAELYQRLIDDYADVAPQYLTKANHYISRHSTSP